MKTTQEKIAIMQAFIEGKTIQRRHRLMDDWSGDASPAWDWLNYDYRVKPEPLELWIVETPSYPRTYTRGFKTRKEADLVMCELMARGNPATLIHYREVTE